MHIKAISEKPNEYPKRFEVDSEHVEWNVLCKIYNPPYYTSNIVLKEYEAHKEKGWADPEDITQVARKIESFIKKLEFDAFNRPMNPMGRTGLCGRGLLGKWGPNFAGDPVVTRLDPLTKKIEMIVIKRKDCLQWALPGGMVDAGEPPLKTIERELEEESGADVSFDESQILYQGYVDDRRNTDNAWIETTVAHCHLNYEKSQDLKLKAEDDAIDVQWQVVDDTLLNNLYASHKAFVLLALEKIKSENLV